MRYRLTFERGIEFSSCHSGYGRLFHFRLPLLPLIRTRQIEATPFRAVKLQVMALTALGVMLFLMHIVDAYWLIMPSFHQTGVSISWMDFTAPIGIGFVGQFFPLTIKRSGIIAQE